MKEETKALLTLVIIVTIIFLFLGLIIVSALAPCLLGEGLSCMNMKAEEACKKDGYADYMILDKESYVCFEKIDGHVRFFHD